MSYSAGRRPLILVVDDDEALRQLLRSALEPRSYRVIGCANGLDAITAVVAEQPQLIVLDYWMPIMDGAGFMRELRELVPRRPPVILFTAASDDAPLARDLGVDVYVEKPVDLKRFLKLVEATLRGASNDVAPRERRRAERRAVRREVEVRLAGASFAPAFTVDLSETGMCLDVGFEPAPGSLVAVAFVLPDRTRLELQTQVRHARDGRVGVQFVGPEDAKREIVAALMSSC